jgi:hypothetical protein
VELLVTNFLFPGLACHSTGPKRHYTAGVALHVGVYGKSSVHPGAHLAHIIGAKDVFIIKAALKIL